MPKTETGTFLVTHADEGSAVLRDVEDAQVHALADNPGVDAGDVVEATLEPVPPAEVAWTVADLGERREVTVRRVDERPAEDAFDALEGHDVGDLVAVEEGEETVHALAVPDGGVDAAVEDVVTDEATRVRAARLGASRVRVRGADGVVSVRYLP
ncbi:MAG: DUF5812 family protein [Halobacteriaceae archaeon]